MNKLHSQMEIFFNTPNWKNYWIKDIKQYSTGNIMEVASGLGSNLFFFKKILKFKKLTCLEPEKKLFKKLIEINKSENKNIFFINKSLNKIKNKNKFDTILYADVLEHIKNDNKEVILAKKFLKTGGRLIFLCPAHNLLFTQFDKNVGHYRRYNKKMFSNLLPDNMKIEKIYYLDSCGFFLSLLNKIILNRNPKEHEIKTWDKYIVPISTIFDKITFNFFGKSIVCIYKNS